MQTYAFADHVVRYHQKRGLPLTMDSVFEMVDKFNIGTLTEKILSQIRYVADKRRVARLDV